jgi:hypothetical protein
LFKWWYYVIIAQVILLFCLNMKDSIISYRELCNKINVNTIQKWMNFRIKNWLTIVLMSVREWSPYNDEIDNINNLLIYEWHDLPKTIDVYDSKIIDQPLITKKWTLTENWKFVKSIEDFKKWLIEPEKVLVFEKLSSWIWSEKWLFQLINYKIEKDYNNRNVFKFILKPLDEDIEISHKQDYSEHTRLIPTHVKIEVFKRDKWKCVLCWYDKNLHYDHDFPFSKWWSSLTSKNVRILCAKCNLKKSDNIE